MCDLYNDPLEKFVGSVGRSAEVICDPCSDPWKIICVIYIQQSVETIMSDLDSDQRTLSVSSVQ